MSRLQCLLCLSICLLIPACAEPVGSSPADAQADSSAAAGASGDELGTSASQILPSGIVELTPDNTQIQFVGTHTGDEPKPRTGVFTDFAGVAAVDPQRGSLQSVAVDIKVDSLVTPFDKLTNHLKSPDFFDAREHPIARFESTSISSQGEAEEHMVTGRFTLMGTTKDISFPAHVTTSGEELKLTGGLNINRSEYGMDKMLEGVHDEVEISVTIGQPTKPPTADRSP